MQTSCPHCQAKFLITQESLNIADGMVRCGQCDHVFDAEKSLILAENSAEEALSDSADTELSNEENNDNGLKIIDHSNNDFNAESELIDDDMLSHQIDPLDDEIFNKLIDEKIEDIPAAEPDLNFSLDDELLESTLKDNFDDDLNDNTHTDSSLDEQLSAAIIESSYAAQGSVSATLQDNKLTADTTDLNSDADLLQQLEQLEGKYTPDNSAKSTKNTAEINTDTDLLQQLDQLEGKYTSASSDDEQCLDEELTAVEPPPASSAKNIPQIEKTEQEPGYFNQSSFSRQSSAALFSWLAGTILLILLLGVQYLHFNSSQLAHNNTYRPFLEILCPISQCKLPLFKSTKKIVTTNHDIYSHKVFENALEVQLTFKNKSTIKQAYPVLEIIFFNPLGTVIAQRKFLADEYIENKTQLSQGINPGQTQQVRLDIIDPDPTALLSFQFNYL
ncbi:MAG: DUF3426 domain-containing protein [Thiotrichaceae bacterium]|nr:DUF3426 domain-containing protein [Thiotrichaceae bacterium]